MSKEWKREDKTREKAAQFARASSRGLPHLPRARAAPSAPEMDGADESNDEDTVRHRRCPRERSPSRDEADECNVNNHLVVCDGARLCATAAARRVDARDRRG